MTANILLGQRIGSFVDCSYLNKSVEERTNGDQRPNFQTIHDECFKNGIKIIALAYEKEMENGGNNNSFYRLLRNIGFDLRLKRIKRFRRNGRKDKIKMDWDVGITVDAISYSEKLDTVVLVTGDGDYLPLVKYLQNRGCRVIVMSYSSNTDTDMKEKANLYIDMDANPDFFYVK